MKLTIVIPTIGRPSLQRAVASAESCADEVIVVADCAPQVMGALHVEFGAAGFARNAGVQAATGDWVGFLDDDDVLIPEVYRAQVAMHPACDVVVHPMMHPVLGPIPRPGTDPLTHGNVGISFTAKRSLLLAHPFIAGPPRTAAIEDYELLRRFADSGKIIMVMAQQIAYLVKPEEHRWPS